MAKLWGVKIGEVFESAVIVDWYTGVSFEVVSSPPVAEVRASRGSPTRQKKFWVATPPFPQKTSCEKPMSYRHVELRFEECSSSRCMRTGVSVYWRMLGVAPGG